MRKVIILFLTVYFMVFYLMEVPEENTYFTEAENFWDQESADAAELRKNLARWYNLNLSEQISDPDFSKVSAREIAYPGGAIGYLLLPRQERYIMVYLQSGNDGLYMNEDAGFPLGQYGGHCYLNYDKPLELSAGEEIILCIFGEAMTYVVDRSGTDSCTIKCPDGSFLCGRAEKK